MGQHFGATPFLIAGPCVVESDELNLRVGEALAELGTKLGVHVIYKGSFDKANRSRLKGARGPGLERGLKALATVRSETGLPDRKSTRLNSSHSQISYAVFCLKKKKKKTTTDRRQQHTTNTNNLPRG